MNRRGRPPRVTWDQERKDGSLDAHVKVKGQPISFRLGADGRLRQIGARGASPDDVQYAKEVIMRAGAD